MYIPEAFAESRLAVLHAAIEVCGLAIFITAPDGAPTATHAPILLSPDEGPLGTLHFHIARANPQWRAIGSGSRALAIFPGPDGYISPSWYASKAEHGRVVPTWNYVAVHAEGTPVVYEDSERLLALVSRLTAHHETARASPWQVADAPKPYIDGMLRAIVGVTMPITKLQGAWKLGQNKNAMDRAGILAGFAEKGSAYITLDKATRGAWTETGAGGSSSEKAGGDGFVPPSLPSSNPK